MKNIKKIYLIITVVIITFTTINFNYDYKSSSLNNNSDYGYTYDRIFQDGVKLSYPESMDRKIYEYPSPQNPSIYLQILYNELGYRFARVSPEDMQKYADCFISSMADKVYSNDNSDSHSQKKNKIASYINDNKEQFIKVDSSNSFIITDSQISIKVGKTYTLSTDSTNKIKWKSSDKKIATVSSNGKVKAKKTGQVKITATDTVTGEKAYCTVCIYKKKKDNLDKWEKKILAQAIKYKEDYKNGKNDYTCMGLAISTMNKVCGSNNYYFYTKQNVSYIYGRNGNKKMLA